LPFFQRHLFELAEPGHEQSHGGLVILLSQERVDHQGKGLGCLEVVEVFFPKGQVGAGGTLLPPGSQGLADIPSRSCGRAAKDVRYIVNLDGGESIPPVRQLLHVLDYWGAIRQQTSGRALA